MKSGKQAKYYQNKGIKCVVGDIFKIDIKDLHIGSEIKIKVKCDICGLIKDKSYREYNNNIKNGGFYSCNKCVNVKNKITRLKIYGDENFNNPEKQKLTCIEKFGVDSYQKSDICKESKKQTCLKKYKKDSYTQTDDFKEKSKDTCLKKYGKEHYSQTDESIKRSENTCLEKYGKYYYSQTDECKEKVKNTSFKKYGHDYYSSSIECRNRVKDTCIERYGVEYAIQNSDIFEKRQLSGYKIKKYKDLYYQGTYELHFLTNFYDTLEIKKPKIIKYKYKNVTKVYHPDFYLPEYNLIVEIKSDYTYNKEIEKNEQKRLGVLENGFNFIFIINKDYTDFLSIIEHNNKNIDVYTS